MSIYIRSSACISPQKTFGTGRLLQDIVEYHDARLRIVEPDYSTLIDSRSLRRMSHVIKMGVAAAKECLRLAEVQVPGAIITGTAYGCMEASSSFEISTIERYEDDLSPTTFMQSTHNTVGAQIALMVKCHQYNNTFVHKGFSFESALQDAIMLLDEHDAETVLAGGIDEMTDISFIILSRLGLYKRHRSSNLSLFEDNSTGTIGGEGAAFFLLSSDPSASNLAELTGLQVFYKPVDAAEIEKRIMSFLAQHSLQISDVDLVITGKNGDPKNDAVYHQLTSTIFKGTTLANYKHLCGEYPTSTSFALWLAANILKTKEIPAAIFGRRQLLRSPKKILIYNHYLGSFHSLMLVSCTRR
jgi:3-oxoacyl-[acyl-carrier-protein] synthase II